jgi:lysophospholipase L1-like esterase
VRAREIAASPFTRVVLSENMPKAPAKSTIDLSTSAQPKDRIFPEMFKGGLAKTNELSKLYEGIASLGGAAFFDAGSVITTDGADGLHLTAEAEKKLGTAVAAKVKEIMK